MAPAVFWPTGCAFPCDRLAKCGAELGTTRILTGRACPVLTPLLPNYLDPARPLLRVCGLRQVGGILAAAG